MPKGTYGIRLSENTFVADQPIKTRSDLELMYGISPALMAHASVHASNYFGEYGFENVGVYLKYRVFTIDGFKSHFRIASFLQAAYGGDRNVLPETELESGTSGIRAGLIFTQLENHLALSSTIGFAVPFYQHAKWQNVKNLDFSISTGILVYPREYLGYSDVNLNLYAELLGKYFFYNQVQGVVSGGPPTTILIPSSTMALDYSIGPQVIINSISRIDLAFRHRFISPAFTSPTSSIFIRYERMFYH